MPQQINYDNLATLARKGTPAPTVGESQSPMDYSKIAAIARASAPAQESAASSRPRPDDRTPNQIAWDQAKSVVDGALKLFTQGKQQPTDLDVTKPLKDQLGKDPVGGRFQGLIPTAVRGWGAVIAPKSVEPPTREEWKQAAEEAGGNLMGTAIGAGLGAGIPKAAGAISEYVPTRLMSSLLKPQERAFDFGADPVQAMLDSNVWGPTMKSTQNRLGLAKLSTEQALQDAVKKYAGHYDDVAPTIRAAVDAEAKAAILDGKPQLAAQLRTVAENRINAIQNKYGTTKLNPGQILEEKRGIAKGVNFTPEATEISLNKAKMNIYSDLDKQMDFMTGDATKALNKNYAGLIEADTRLASRAQQLKNSQIGGSDARGIDLLNFPIRLLDKVIPEALWKTKGAQWLKTTPAPTPQTFSPLPSAFKPPVKEGPGSVVTTMGNYGAETTGVIRPGDSAGGGITPNLAGANYGAENSLPDVPEGQLAYPGKRTVVGKAAQPVAVYGTDPLTGERIIIGIIDAATGTLMRGRLQ